jgi:hypothetical protein
VPIDPHGFDEDDEVPDAGRRKKFHEWECPDCAAPNPYDDGFGDGDDLTCCYCGVEFRAAVNADGNLKLKPT